MKSFQTRYWALMQRKWLLWKCAEKRCGIAVVLLFFCPKEGLDCDVLMLYSSESAGRISQKEFITYVP